MANNGKVQTEGVVAKGKHSTSHTPKVTEDRKIGARLCFCVNHILKDCPSKAKTNPYQVKAYIPLVKETSENVPSVAGADHSSGNDANVSPLETNEPVLSMVFNNSKTEHLGNDVKQC